MELTSWKRLLVGRTLFHAEAWKSLAAAGSHSDGLGGGTVVQNARRPSLEADCAQTIKPRQPCVALPAWLGTERLSSTAATQRLQHVSGPPLPRHRTAF